MTRRTGVLLLNVGTPASPDTGAVRRYLAEFLNDERVLDLPAVPRGLLLYGAILPFRPKMSAHAYRKIWTEEGSPLLVASESLATALRARLRAPVALAMRYGEPSLPRALDALLDAGIERIVAAPLFPQYSSATTGSALEALYREAARRTNVPALSIVPPFYDHPAFLGAFAAGVREQLRDFGADRVLMSFHGLPVSQVMRSDTSGRHCYRSNDCCAAIGPANLSCYRAQCHATARGLAAELGLAADRWEIAFQSRLGRVPWIEPYTDRRVAAMPAEGVKRLAVLCPAFVADCLETLEEIGIRARESFLRAGGEAFELLPCPNASPAWVDALIEILRETCADLSLNEVS